MRQETIRGRDGSITINIIECRGCKKEFRTHYDRTHCWWCATHGWPQPPEESAQVVMWR